MSVIQKVRGAAALAAVLVIVAACAGGEANMKVPCEGVGVDAKYLVNCPAE